MKDRTILAIKGLAIIGVVFHHLANRRQEPAVTEGVIWLLFLFHWCVLAFIAVSGYLHAWSDTRRIKGVTEFVVLRFNRLMVPFFLLVLAYALIWQILQTLHVPGIGQKIPHDFWHKIAVSLWPVRGGPHEQLSVGEQLYYLPILFAVSVVFVLVRHIPGWIPVWILLLTTFVIGLRYFPSDFTAFSLGVFLWSVCFYAAGYLLFLHRERIAHVRLTLLVCTVLMILYSGYWGMIRCVPLWLIAEGASLRLAGVPGLPALGDASGTIYIYHTPFILQPLVIASTSLHGSVLQFIGVLGAAAAAIGICYAFHQLARDTPARVLLL